MEAGSGRNVVSRLRRSLLLGLALVFALPVAGASAAINGTSNSADVANAITVDPPTGSAFTLNYPGPTFPHGFADTPLTGFPTNAATYGILTSGDVQFADDENASGGTGHSHGTTSYNQAKDPTTLRIDVNVPSNANCLAFDFRFLSEEYPEYVNAGFNDAFIAQLNNLAITVTGSTINAPGDFAGGAGDQISVDAAGPSAMTAENAAGTTYDGATPRLVARTPVNPGGNTVYLTIFDAGDHILDSAVFVDNLRFEAASQGQCKSLAVDPYEGETGVDFSDPNNPVKLCEAYECAQFGITCNLPGGGEVPCSPFILVTVNFQTGQLGSATARAKTSPVDIAGGQANVPAGQTQTVSLPTTPEGQKALKDAVKKSKKLKKQAKKLLKEAKQADGAEAKKLKKKAKKLKKQAKQLLTPSGQVTVYNDKNGATEVVPFELELK